MSTEPVRPREAAPVRPGIGRWIWYAFGGGLPERYALWVLHDTTASTWVLRHIVRTLVVLVVPTAALLLFLPASFGTRVLTVGTVSACALLLTAILSNDVTERRLHRTGLPWGAAEQARNRRAVQSQRETAQRYRERMAARRRS